MTAAPVPPISDRIRAAAAYRGLSLRELADALHERHPNVRGVSHGRLLQLGITGPPARWQLDAIADVCGVPPWFLTDGFLASTANDRPATVADLAALESRLFGRPEPSRG